MKLFFTLLYITICFSAFSDNSDSLINQLSKTENTDNLELLSKISSNLINTNPIKSKEYSTKGLIIAKNNKDTAFIISFLRQKGNIFYQQSNYDSSLFYFNESLKLAQITNDRKNIISVKLNIASLYLEKHETKQAINLFNEVLTQAQKQNNENIQALALNNLGLAYQYENNYKKAIAYFEKALKIKKKNSSEISIANTMSNLGQTYGYIGDNKKAIEIILSALDVYTKNNDNYNAALACFNISKFYYAEKENSLAETFLFRAIDLAKQIDYKQLLSNSYLFLSEIRQNLGDGMSSLKYYKLYKQYSDSLINIEHENYYNRLKVEFETERKEAKIKMQTSEIKTKSIALYLSIVGIIILLIFITIILFQKKALSITYKKLLEQNISSIETEEELETTIEQLKQLKQEPVIEKLQVQKNNKSDVSNELLNEIHTKLIKAIKEDKVYKNKGLTIFDLADLLETNKSYLSRVINDNYKMNFNTFINYHRVKEVQKLLKNPDNKTYTIAALSEEVGFKSLSVFNKAFKDNTGLTPSYYLKELKKQA